MSETTSAPPPTVETHDPLPEGKWFWRRLFVFAVCTAITVGDWLIIQAMLDQVPTKTDTIVNALVKITGWHLLFGWFAMTYYIVGTNAEQVVKIVQTAGLFKQGITQTVTQVATASDGSKAAATTTTGPASPTAVPLPSVVPPPPPAPPPEEPPWPTH